MKLYSVYKHTCPNGKVYVGISSNPERRWQSGFGYASNVAMFADIVKYGWDNWTHEILYDCLTKGEASGIETTLIIKFDSTNPNFGYNKRSGTDDENIESAKPLNSKESVEKWCKTMSEDDLANKPTREVYIEYVKWCKNLGAGVCGKIEFSKSIQRWLLVTIKDKRVNGTKCRVFVKDICSSCPS